MDESGPACKVARRDAFNAVLHHLRSTCNNVLTLCRCTIHLATVLAVFAVQMCLRSAAWNPSLRIGLDLSLVFSLVLRLVLSLDLGLPLSLTLGLALTPALSLPLSALFRAPVKVSKGL